MRLFIREKRLLTKKYHKSQRFIGKHHSNLLHNRVMSLVLTQYLKCKPRWHRSKVLPLILVCTLAYSDPSLKNLSLSKENYQQIKEFYGDSASKRVKDWMKLLQEAKELPEPEKLQQVNQFFNQLEFVSDEEHWHKQDYWATPLEMLVTNGGDCEDFSVAKYFSLRELKVDMSKLRLTYVKALELNQAHMVLSYFPDEQAEPLVLDNLIDTIEPASKRSDLQPFYSFNGEDLWLSKERARGQWVGKSSRISLWQDLLTRFSEQLVHRQPLNLQQQSQEPSSEPSQGNSTKTHSSLDVKDENKNRSRP